MTTYIHHIETVVPPYPYSQDYARDRMTQWLPDRRTQRLIRGIYDHSGIETRYSVLPDFTPGETPLLFHEDSSGRLIEPSTGPRNQHYAHWAGDLVVEASRKALQKATGFEPGDVTHVITVSCTGFCNPGPDLRVVQDIGLPDSVERYNLGFMGCYAAFPALRMAQQFCQARQDAVVLVVCVELCSLHLQLREEPDSLLANALFADGVAAAVVSARRPHPQESVLALHTFLSALLPEGAGDMAWSIGDRGFDIRLSAYVPRIIGSNIATIVDNILIPSPWNREDIGIWAVHPGGRSILDKIEKELGLAAPQLADARAVLREYGNMSSTTMLFVLQRILAHERPAGPICAMAFGPGLTVETAVLERQAGRLSLTNEKHGAHADPT